jgi:hypothetical protein
VFRNWRSGVFGSRAASPKSPTPETRVRKTLAVRPYLPIFVQQRQYGLLGGDADNIVAALEYNDRRVCETDLFDISSSHLEKAEMQGPFPALTRLEIRRKDDDGGGTRPVVLNLFMDGSAPRLRYLDMTRVPFLGLPRLLSSATTSFVCTFGKHPILATFHPRRSSLASPH